ncbi:FAD-dependent monooxygenase [Dactylosporangium sp. AC04546]|uniref:FAD-dependent monooxygenase n=1 Tax=Dactylosporangium sp. AC04546 TaxID=2862460 RepID=UPI001EDD4567|nr:FAD-dependent monooxygenase [Dactylosporangium sp. AC04546]WVK88112.1 FAD-dependent monooxygenase [Dactylosporangium sp. AC04546]
MIDVIIVGAGPAGLLLACELRLAGVGTVVLERHRRRPDFCRGFNLNARALDLLARRGLADALIAEGWQVPHAAFSGLPVTLGLAGTHTDHPYSLGIPQTRVEEVLEAHAVARGADLRRGHEVRGLRQDDDGVEVTVATGDGEYRLRARYVVGCDGSRSTVRKQAGIAFPGTPATRWSLLGDVEPAEPLPFGVSSGPGGWVFVIPRPGYVRIITADNGAERAAPTLEEFQAAVGTALGRPVPIRQVRWLARFGDAARQAAEYVRGRVVLAGDAAHIHPPAGAIGVNVALDDAFNLGWKLAATVKGTAPAHLLGTYHDERHAAGEHVLANTQAQVLLGEADGNVTDLLTRVARHPDGNRALAETVTGLDTRYPMVPAADHPWLGRLALSGDGTLAALQEQGRGVLVGPDDLAEIAEPWAGHVVVTPGTDRPAILVRPDGHTAWVQTDGAEGLREALEHWFGPPVSGAPRPVPCAA